MKDVYGNPVFKVDMAMLEEQSEQVSFDCGSSITSRDGLSSLEALSLSFGELRSEVGSSVLQDEEDDGCHSTVSADGSSPWLPTTSRVPSADLMSKSSWDVKPKSEPSGPSNYVIVFR